jgi:hypothetical protein
MSLLTAALVLALSLDPPKDKFTGGFIQLTNSMAVDDTRLTRQQWRDVLQSMKQTGMTTVIVQYLVLKEATGDRSLMRPGTADDATELILSEADDLKGMTVLIGLWDCDFPTSKFNTAFFVEAKSKTLAAAETAWNDMHYGRHASFGGWYIPVEPWNFKKDPDKIALLADFLAAVTAKCKELAPSKPVAFSCYFNPDQVFYASPAETTNVYKQVFDRAKIDILMLQDGVGEYGHAAADCQAYFTAYKAACGEKVRFWGDLECFTRTEAGIRVPADAARLAAQFASAKGSTETCVTFDFFHYMNPNKYTDHQGVEYQGMCAGGLVGPRKALYDAYRLQIGVLPGK